MSNGFRKSDSSSSQWHKIYSKLEESPDELLLWEDLVDHLSSESFGLCKASPDNIIQLFRFTYDSFLERFPLLYGYWIKYAEQEFQLGFTEIAQTVYERGIAAVPYSVELWTKYCEFYKFICVRDPSQIRWLFERAVNVVGNHFLAHSLWDSYLDFEERILESPPEVIFKLLDRIIHIPLHQYARYYSKFRALTPNLPVDILAPRHYLNQFKAEFEIELELEENERLAAAAALALANTNSSSGNGRKVIEANAVPTATAVSTTSGAWRRKQSGKAAEADLRLRISNYHRDIYCKTQLQVFRRFPFESSITRHYFNVLYLDEAEMVNWRKFLDFQEIETSDDHDQIILLYERALIPTAHYEEIWFRYIRWLLAHNREEDALNVFRRACFILPVGRPKIRYYFANFLRSRDLLEEARIVLESVLQALPDSSEAIIQFSHVLSSAHDKSSAIEYLNQQLRQQSATSVVVAIIQELVRLYISNDQIDLARNLYESAITRSSLFPRFWHYYLNFEIAQPSSSEKNQRIKSIIYQIRASGLPETQIKSLSHVYMSYLLNDAENSVSEFMVQDRFINRVIV